MKQSLKFTLPKINEPVKFNEFINQTFEGKVCIAHCIIWPHGHYDNRSVLQVCQIWKILENCNSLVLFLYFEILYADNLGY